MRFRDFLITEGKQDIINLGYPPLIASMFYQKFGNLAFLLAKWYRDSKCYTQDTDNWWRRFMYTPLGKDVNVDDLIRLYYATKDPDEYVKVLNDLEWRVDDETYDEFYLQEQKERLRKQIEQHFFGETFFHYYSLIKDVISGELSDLAPYKNLPFFEAQKKYDKQKIFKDMKPLKVYPNGYKWINVGKRCYLLGRLMKNCGSSGMMSWDSNSTIIALFNKANKPHVLVTYSPSENRISGDEGRGSTEVKSMYHDYVLDLAKTLGANFDANKSRSNFLATKWKLKDHITNIQKLPGSSIYNHFYVFTINDGRQFYTDGYSVVSSEDLQKLRSFPFQNRTGTLVRNVFNQTNKQEIANKFPGIFTPISQFNQS